MEDSDLNQDIINKISAIRPYFIWGKNGIIDKIMLWLISIPTLIFALIILFYISNGIIEKYYPQMLDLTTNYNAYYPVAVNIIYIYLCAIMMFFIFLSIFHGIDVLSNGKKNNEAKHNYFLIVQNSKLSDFELNTMKIIVSVNLTKTSKEIKYYLMTGAMFVFLISSWPTLSKFLKLDAELFFDSTPFPIFLLLSSFLVSVVILFGIFIEVQRRSAYALNVIEAAISYKRTRYENIFKIKKLTK
ncbi:hypothetical protein [Sodalis sp. dw_96]|uniref:hypothetical protein n=1 Tax=Sodalis sp. dw_96 TaxID=2719794 RepID=UPI001BD3D143|nr:hypothetical protein [Sodalis sp. dw_96]